VEHASKLARRGDADLLMALQRRDIGQAVIWRYALALLLVAGLSTGAFVALFKTLTGEERQAELLRLVAKQEAASMRTAFFANALAVAEDDIGRDSYRRELGRSIRDMERRHDMIVHGDGDADLTLKDVARVNELMFAGRTPFDAQVQTFIENAKLVADLPDDELDQEHAYLLALNLAGMNFVPQGFAIISDILKDEREQTLRYLEAFELAVWLSTLTLLVLEALLIFRPLVRRVRAAVSEVSVAQREAEAHAVAAEAATRAKSRFLANVNHEIRTPLNGIMGTAALLEQSELSPTQRKHVEILRESGATLLELIEDVLDISRIEAGVMTLRKDRFSCAEVVGHVARIMQGTVDAKGIALVTEVASDLAQPVIGDAARTKQVLLNLTGNAAKFTEAGQIEITAVRKDGDMVCFSVGDTGPGIPDDQLEIVFERFRQGQISDRRSAGGVGLGLAICSELVGQMGGRIGVESKLGAGSRFWFMLPLRPAPELRDVAADDAAEPETPAIASGTVADQAEIRHLAAVPFAKR